MKEIFINVDSFNSDSIGTIQNNNNCDSYKIYILKNKRRLDITNKTVRMCYVRTGTKDRDIIDLEITNAKEGEVTLPVTNRITAKDGVYCCQLAIYGENNFLEHTTKFTLTVESNIFAEIAEEIANRSDFSYLENILYKSEKLSEKLKENTSTATNANSNLESNITEANNINSKLLENTSTATSLNKNLESNIDLAKEVKETIKDLNSKNTEATEKIGTLTSLNSKATELSNNINESLSVKDSLIKNTESAKIINNELIATNNDAKVKKTDLDNSLEEAKKFINGLDGSQNIPQIRMDVTELQNGLKSNQSLAYKGSSISADNTLEGRTEGMKIEGKTMYKKADGTYTDTWEEGVTLESFGETEGNKISSLSKSLNNIKFEQGTFDKTQGTVINVTTRITSNLIEGNFKSLLNNNLDFKEFMTIIFAFDLNKRFISTTSDWSDHLEISNLPINTKYIRIVIKRKNEKTISPNDIANVYFGESNKKDILIKEPLRGFDENTCDIMYEDNGQVKVDRKLSEYTFTGDENWQPSSELQDELICFYISFPLTTATTPILCNNFIQKPTMEKGIECITNNGGGNSTVRIKINKSKLTTPDINGFKAWLKANPTTIVYQLATPVIEVVENCVDIDLDTFQDKTYFNILNSLPGTLDFKVPSNIASIVQSNSKAINELYNLIDTLVLPNILQNTTDIEMLKLEKLK